MYTIRASSLGTFNVNPYKYKYGEFTGDPMILELGNIIHYFTRDEEGGIKILDRYTSEFNKDLKMDYIAKKMFANLQGLLDQINSKAKKQYNEIPMLQKYGDVLVTGTADKIVEFEGSDVINIFDWKTTNSLNRYSDPYRKLEEFPDSRIREENLQWLAYGLGAMQYFGYKKASFSFVALEKKGTAKMKLFTKEFTLEEGEKKIKEVCESFEYSNDFDYWPHKRSRYCMFKGGCGKECPNNPDNKGSF